LRSRDIRIVTSVGVLNEGFDAPMVDCVCLARPTMSSILFVQQTGRCLRPSPGKKDCLILDIVDNVGKFDVQDVERHDAVKEILAIYGDD